MNDTSADARDIGGATEVVLVAAVSTNGVIGNGNDLVFKDPIDQKHFRDSTWGAPVIMGRKTWDSLPERFRPLPGRQNIVLSRNPDFRPAGALAAQTLTQALHFAAPASRIFVIGGAQLYALALPLATELLLTEIHAELPGDTHFPPWDRGSFAQISRRPGRPRAQSDQTFDKGPDPKAAITGASSTRTTQLAVPAFDFVRYRRRTAEATDPMTQAPDAATTGGG